MTVIYSRRNEGEWLASSDLEANTPYKTRPKFSVYVMIKRGISQNQSKWGVQNVKTTVPPGQQAAMQASYLLGKSIRQIAREQHRDPATVSKIVKSGQMEKVVQDMREKFFGELLPKALYSVQFALEEEADGRLGYQVLMDSGVVPRGKQTLNKNDAAVDQTSNRSKA
jgi:hypothetical protein